MADESGSLFRGAGFAVPGQAPTAPGSLFTAAGLKLPGENPASTVTPAADWPAGAVDFVVMPGTGRRIYVDDKGHPLRAADEHVKPTLEDRIIEIQRATSPAEVALKAARSTGQSIGKSYDAAIELANSGRADLAAGHYAPSFPSTDPATWSGGGLLKTAAGAAGVPLSPLSGALDALVEQPLAHVTGNPEFASRAALVVGGKSLKPPTSAALATTKALAPSAQAVNALVKTIGPENVLSAAERLRANPRLSLMDVSDPVRTMAQGLIDPAQAKAQEILTNAVRQRTASSPAAVNAAYTEAMGSAPDVVKMVEGLKETARNAGREAIQPALKNAKPVDVTPVITAIDKELKPGITAMLDPGTRLPLSDLQTELVRFKSQLTDGRNIVFDPQKLHDIQSRMGDMAFQLSKSSDAKQRMLGSQLRNFNEKLIDQIDTASNGAYRPARAKFKDAKDIHEAFDAGFDTLKNRAGLTGLEDRPEALRDWIKAATPEEIAARQLGTRADIDQKIRGVKNQALAGTNITSIEYNREKLAALFGKKETDRLVRAMEDARDEATTNAKLIANSKTAETLAGQKALEIRKVGGGNPLQYVAPVAAELLGQSAGLPGVGGTAVVAAGLAHRAGQYVNKQRDIARNIAFAKAASASGPAREQTINALLSHPKVIRALQKSGNALAIP